MDYPQEHIKPYGEDGKKSEQVEEMFDNIAPAYDKLNHTLSLGIDRSWRRKAIHWLKPFQPKRIMDVATGTGDFAILACRELQPDELIGTDISEGMMDVGRNKVKQAHLSKDNSAYTYLPQSIRAFPQGEVMQEVIRKAGFSQVNFRRLTFGICTLYTATK